MDGVCRVSFCVAYWCLIISLMVAQDLLFYQDSSLARRLPCILRSLELCMR